jgi:superfamily II RNA helicase
MTADSDALRRERGELAFGAGVPGDEGSELRHWRGFELSPFQVRAISALRAGSNVLVGAPTGAGKTLVAEYAIHDAVARGKRCIYTAPIKALSNQKFRDFRAAGLDVGLQTGDVTIQPRAQVLIMTTEILRNAVFENPADLVDVEFAIFDEVHFLDDAERGTVWEEALIFAPATMRFVCLSATVPNIGELGAWLREIRTHELVVIESKARPVPLEHLLFHPRRGVFGLDQLPKVRREIGREQSFERGTKRKRRSRHPERSNPRPQRGSELQATERLLDLIQSHQWLPTLVFAFSRKDCERLARRNSDRDLLTRDEHEAMQRLQRELAASFHVDDQDPAQEVFAMARRGLGFHHAGMLPLHKELVERLFTSGLLKLLFTTETFALGINMPARCVVFHSLVKFDGVGVDYLRCREYQQMAGRAGRQGIDTEGMVFSVVDERDLAQAPLERILSGQTEPVHSRFRLSYSSLLHLVSDLSRERVHEAWEKSFNQFQHRRGTQKERDKNQRKQRRVVDAHLAVLDDLGYIEGDGRLTPRGQVARWINGYELQVTELLFAGVLDGLAPQALVVVFVALIFEERKRAGSSYVPSELHGAVRRHVGQLLFRLAGREAELGVPTPMKLPDWGLTPAVVAWCDGRQIEELSEVSETSPGDIVRSLRMALQLMRQVRHAIDRDWELHAQLAAAMALINRDEVDARAQLEHE